MIERLSLKDFKSHEDSDIKFHLGLNVFLGEVGAGKTSVLEAISFALFGRYAGNVTKAQLIRRGAEKADISMIFSTRFDRYKVHRTIHPRKGQRAKLWIQDGKTWKQVVEGATPVSRSIEDLLNVDSTTFLAAIYASQGEIKEMLETQPGKRREQLDKLLGIDMYQNIWATLGDAKNTLLRELVQTQKKADGVNQLEEQIKDLAARVKREKNEVEMLETSIKEIEEKLQEDEQRLEKFVDQEQRLIQLESQIKSKNNETINSSNRIESMKAIVRKASEAEKAFQENRDFILIEKELKEKIQRIESLLEQRKHLETWLSLEKAEFEEARKRQHSLEAQMHKLEALRESLIKLEKEAKNLKELEHEKDELEKKLDLAKEVAIATRNEITRQRKVAKSINELGECPTCLQVVPADHKEKITYRTNEKIEKLKANQIFNKESKDQILSQLDRIRKELDRVLNAEKEYFRVYGQIQGLIGTEDDLDQTKSKKNELQAKIQESERKLNDIKETPEMLHELTEKLRNATSRAELAREAEKQMAAKEDLQETLIQENTIIQKLRLQLEGLKSSKRELTIKYNPDAHVELKEKISRARSHVNKSVGAIEQLNQSIAENVSQARKTSKQLKEKKIAQSDVERLEKENTILEVLRRSIRDVVQPVMRKNTVLKVSEAFQSFYQELSNDNIDYASIDEEGNIDAIRNGQPSPVNSLSGGETTCAALALRLAICSSLTKNQLLLLDEPTIHLDELYRAKLKDFLGNHKFEQLIIVTHDNTFDSLPAQIFRLEKKRGESVVTPLMYGGS